MPYNKINPDEEVRGGVLDKMETEMARAAAEIEVNVAANAISIGTNASAITANASAITSLQTSVAKKIIQEVVAGVVASETIELANAPSSIVSVLAVVSATGAPATKYLLDITTDYTISGTTLTCVTDQSLNKLIVNYLV